MAAEFLTPSGLAERVQKETGLDIETAKNFAVLFFKIVKRELKNADSFSVHNFGTFKKTWIPEGTGNNPQNGETIVIPAHYRIKFTPSPAVAARINARYANLKPRPIKENAKELETSTIPVPEPVLSYGEQRDPFPLTKSEETQKLESLREVIPADEDDSDDDDDDEKSVNKMWIFAGIAALSTAILVALLISVLVRGCSRKKTENTTAPVAVEKTEQLPSESSEVNYSSYIVPDGSCYHRIAGEKFGDRHLWPYIYSANKAAYPDPDLIDAHAKITIPSQPNLQKDKTAIESSVLDAYNGYLYMIEKEPKSAKNANRRELAARVLVSGEKLYPGFISAHENRILPEYAQKARTIASKIVK